MWTTTQSNKKRKITEEDIGQSRGRLKLCPSPPRGVFWGGGASSSLAYPLARALSPLSLPMVANLTFSIAHTSPHEFFSSSTGTGSL